MPPDSTETELGSSEQEASPSAGKYTGVAGRIAHFAHGSVPKAISTGVENSEVPGYNLLRQMCSQ